jgi:hypothetical protein
MRESLKSMKPIISDSLPNLRNRKGTDNPNSTMDVSIKGGIHPKCHQLWDNNTQIIEEVSIPSLTTRETWHLDLGYV